MSSGNQTVLLVDDDPDMIGVLKTALTGLGFDTLLARDGVEGLEQFKKHHPPVVISDIYMPRKNGVDLLDDIKKESPETRVILITGYAHYRELTKEAEFAPDAFLRKPFSLVELVDLVKKAFEEQV